MTALAALCLAGALGVAFLVLAGARALGWRRRQIALLARPWLLAIWILLTIGVSAAASDGGTSMEARDWALISLWLAVTVLTHAIDRQRKSPSHPARRWGARMAHAGIAIAIGGLLLSSIFTGNALRSMAPGETIKINDWTIQLHDVWPAAGEGWAGVSAELRATRGGGVVLLEPELRHAADGTVIAKAATVASGTGKLTATIGPRDASGDWPIRLRSVPLLVLIPLGGIIAAIGGALAMVGQPIARRRRLNRARLASAWWA